MNKKKNLIISALAATAVGALAYLNKGKIKDLIKTEREEIHFSDFEDLENEVVFADLDGDGKIDVAYVDTTNDGKLDTAFVDVDGNGTVDVAIPIEEIEKAEEANEETTEEE